jgi:hypothetical protein
LRPRVYRDRPQLARHEIARPTRIDRLHDSSQFVLSGKLWRGWSAQSVELLADITTAPSRCATDPHPARPSFGAMRLYRSVLIDFFPKCFNRIDVSWPIVRNEAHRPHSEFVFRHEQVSVCALHSLDLSSNGTQCSVCSAFLQRRGEQFLPWKQSSQQSHVQSPIPRSQGDFR